MPAAAGRIAFGSSPAIPISDQKNTSPAAQVNISVSIAELSTILAALRLIQIDTDHLPASIEEIATDGGGLRPLPVNEIDALCERLNCDAHPVDSSGLLKIAREFCEVVQANGVDYVKRIWPALHITYERMQEAIAKNAAPVLHTPEPWVFDTLDDKIWLLSSDDDYLIELVTSDAEGKCRSYQEAYANAERILECVNGCKGVNPNALTDLMAAAEELLEDFADTGEDRHPETGAMYGCFEKLTMAVRKAKGD